METIENQIELFEFTNEEEQNIAEITLELTELMCVMVSQGVSITEDTNKTTIFDIISCIIGDERKKSLNFAMVSSKHENGAIKIDGFISQKSKVFLENLLTYQLEALEENIPLALDYARKNGNLLEKSTNIYSLPDLKKPQITNQDVQNEVQFA